ncbi:hypothetical protein AN958_12002 [Leucoagaricus sp. SymC.cos]|nr:hypothetical protein AN958_12002 [Leucoagaricus sp. SymC.cos]
MMFSRVAIEFGTFYPTSSLLVDDEAGDIGLQDLSTDEINCVGYFPLVVDSPLPGAFSCTITSLGARVAQDPPLLPTPSPPSRLTRRPADSQFSSARSSSQAFHISPSWAHTGLCITGFTMPEPTGEPQPSPTNRILNDVVALISHEEFAFPWASRSECFGFPASHRPSDHLERHLEHFSPFVPEPLRDVFNEEEILQNLVGVLNVGHPLRPSEAYYGLAGLGITTDTDYWTNSEDKDSAASDQEEFFESPGPLYSLPSLRETESLIPEFVGDWDPIMNQRSLFVIAEEDDKDWHSPPERSTTPIPPLNLDDGDTQIVSAFPVKNGGFSSIISFSP